MSEIVDTNQYSIIFDTNLKTNTKISLNSALT